LGLFYFFLLSTFKVIRQIGTGKWLYGSVLGALLLHFSVTDLELHHTNECQTRLIQQIAHSREKTVRLNENCSVLSWSVITDPEQSVLQGELLALWRIMDEPKRFYYQDP
jgi:hypothetical protein